MDFLKFGIDNGQKCTVSRNWTSLSAIVLHARQTSMWQVFIFTQSEQSNGEVAFCQRVTIQEYEEQKRLVTQRSLEELLSSITNDQEMNEKERKRKLKQVRTTNNKPIGSSIIFHWISISNIWKFTSQYPNTCGYYTTNMRG